METVKKGSKINFYKFVDADKESDARSKSGATKSTIALTKVIRSNTQAINGIGAVTNSIAKTLIGIRDTTANLLKIDKEKLRRESDLFVFLNSGKCERIICVVSLGTLR